MDGRSYLQPVPYAKALTDQGYVALAIDHWCFGERSHTSEGDTFKAMLWQGRVLWGMMVYDSLRALDWLLARPDVDASRVGTLGISMGSTMAWWLAALDERVRVTVDICCLTDFHTLLARKGLGLHGVYYYVPRLLKHFTTADINALIVPRAHLALAGLRDDLTPVEGLDSRRRGAEARLRGRRSPRAVEAPPLRRWPPGDGRGARGDPGLPPDVPARRSDELPLRGR